MKRQSIQKKRISPEGGGLFVFHSKVSRRKRQRVAASADLSSEVPNLGVARALFVILLLHVAAIAAIFIHNRVTSEDVVAVSTDSETESSRSSSSVEPVTAANGGETFYFVSTGDTYERIAHLKSVDAQELRDLNGGKGLDPGAILRIPPSKTVLTTVPPATDRAAGSRSPEQGSENRGNVAVVVSSNTEESRDEGGANSSSSILVNAVADPEGEGISRAIPVSEDEPASRTYSVKSGDTAWKIARLFKISVKSLLEENRIEDARRLQVNMKLRIPTP